MYIPKKYGQSRVDKCPFCGQQATAYNAQKVPTCLKHKDSGLGEMKCSCGSWLEMKSGKFGIFFTCLKCGNMNLKKVLEINECKKEMADGKEKEAKKDRAVETVYPDDPRYFD